MKADPSLEERVVETLDAQAEGLDAGTVSKLREASARAVRKAEGRGRASALVARGWSLPAGALAAMLCIAVALSVWRQGPKPRTDLNQLVAAPAVVVEMAEAELDMELIEDIEFYDWLLLAQSDVEPQ